MPSEVALDVDAVSAEAAGQVAMDAVKQAAFDVLKRHGHLGAVGFVIGFTAEPVDTGPSGVREPRRSSPNSPSTSEALSATDESTGSRG